jgi:hypothetical protein
VDEHIVRNGRFVNKYSPARARRHVPGHINLKGKRGAEGEIAVAGGCARDGMRWAARDLNPRPSACKAGHQPRTATQPTARSALFLMSRSQRHAPRRSIRQRTAVRTAVRVFGLIGALVVVDSVDLGEYSYKRNAVGTRPATIASQGQRQDRVAHHLSRRRRRRRRCTSAAVQVRSTFPCLRLLGRLAPPTGQACHSLHDQLQLLQILDRLVGHDLGAVRLSLISIGAHPAVAPFYGPGMHRAARRAALQ